MLSENGSVLIARRRSRIAHAWSDKVTEHVLSIGLSTFISLLNPCTSPERGQFLGRSWDSSWVLCTCAHSTLSPGPQV